VKRRIVRLERDMSRNSRFFAFCLLLVLLVPGVLHGQPVGADEGTPVVAEPIAPDGGEDANLSGDAGTGAQAIPNNTAIYMVVCETQDPDLAGT
jgi:hypothetical protein